MDLIESNLNQIQVLCAKHRVKNLFVFGSVLGPYVRRQVELEKRLVYGG